MNTRNTHIMHPKFSTLAVTLCLTFILGFLHPIQAKRQKFEPLDNKALLVIGQCLDGVGGLPKFQGHAALQDGYIDGVVGSNSDLFPGGVTIYSNVLFTLGLDYDQSFPEPQDAGVIHGHRYMYYDKFNNSVIVIGLDLQNQTIEGQELAQLRMISEGKLDQEIAKLAGWIKRTNRPVFLRIGYEFNLEMNKYNANTYKSAWKRIVNVFRECDVQNCAFVWQAADAGEAPDNISSYWPGDEYVDWCGFSWFTGIHNSLISWAKNHDKPVMIAEATTKFHSTAQTGANDLWNGYYSVVIGAMKNSSNRIKALCYINQNWEEQGIWQGTFKDSRIQVNPDLKRMWLDEIKKDFWLHASSNLFNILNNGVVAEFKNDAIRCYKNSSIKFESTSYGSIDSYEWNFGDGANPATATGKGPHTVKYTSTGDKKVTLKVSGSGKSDTKTKDGVIKVSAYPTGDYLWQQDFTSGNSVTKFAGPFPPWKMWEFSHVEGQVFRSHCENGHDDYNRQWYLINDGNKPITVDVKHSSIKPVVKIRARKKPMQVGTNDKACLTVSLVDKYHIYTDKKMEYKNRLPLTTNWQELTVDFSGEMENVMGTDKHDFAIFGSGPLAQDVIAKIGIGINYDWYNYPDEINGVKYDYFFQGDVDIDYIKFGEIGPTDLTVENNSLKVANYLTTVYNQTKGILDVTFTNPQDLKNANIAFYTLQGKKIALSQTVKTSKNMLRYSVKNISNGLYVIRASLGKVILNKEVLIY